MHQTGSILLGYREPQILEVFKNTHPYMIILGIASNRRPKTVETAKKLLMKER